ncbi:hypothetical protein A2954_01640 [Candidatus Roizmanbacteria bacterium RIFCSPLOWO2_01_FULL_37_12]|uniref:Uncharacterized protein n=1 Tax=Candidatus Roizmanbacteria bacterium RIFCSPLOWO2_01_FULL_37_12 TaxID=1802056 RepID=A0A1F7IA10_9BACT|nr:MAG: hypothetical protein A3D76_05460 [Candidatus Roizmanbacteria bacterium RIFCSPHIGHO2_02_FULL_37_9b]OGK40198.1 MAG: hypothetical protein A2954_01640 [Candidatus Roizmanbacteria bacterium RIFCSPLOWO2_01_FULL_37_12]
MSAISLETSINKNRAVSKALILASPLFLSACGIYNSMVTDYPADPSLAIVNGLAASLVPLVLFKPMQGWQESENFPSLVVKGAYTLGFIALGIISALPDPFIGPKVYAGICVFAWVIGGGWKKVPKK